MVCERIFLGIMKNEKINIIENFTSITRYGTKIRSSPTKIEKKIFLYKMVYNSLTYRIEKKFLKNLGRGFETIEHFFIF